MSKERNFSDLEIESITSQVQLNKLVLYGSLKSGIKGSWKNAVWNEIIAMVNSIAEHQLRFEYLMFTSTICIVIYMYMYIIYNQLYCNLYLGQEKMVRPRLQKVLPPRPRPDWRRPAGPQPCIDPERGVGGLADWVCFNFRRKQQRRQRCTT